MTPYVADPVYLNGRFLPLAEAGISPLDRGFLYGDGVYELIPVYSRRAFRIDEHVKRLQATLDGIKLANPLTADGWKEVIGKLIETAPWDDQSIYLQVTRGADDKRDHAFPPASVPSTAFAFASPLVTTPAEVRAKGVAAITVPDLRWSRCDLKVISLLANVLARQQAVEQGCAEALLIRDGLMKEGAASNIFIVKDGVLLAPPKTHLMLPGITYDVILELAATHQQALEVREISETELRSADEVWMTSSTKEILAITTLDGEPVGNGPNAGQPGPFGEQMWQWYQDFKNTVMRKG
ncbi:D-amino acid aminotransferase [Ferribacterium limneticum]|uniref:D-amino acid aminotransferase n=1 Tax=Ferribacterium limneticum TaxID=76259 RepID=UPI001CFABA16|nr:D-amino acid aminotransferase [Ferribacterium limneticum]UCV28819.1 D-amino acid aminotransferase [Ferribacterium limneticum]UCV32737.1 D-amino acid aminotransferase [Ferribacterium limneticum]